jgi:hypothetical protein
LSMGVVFQMFEMQVRLERIVVNAGASTSSSSC